MYHNSQPQTDQNISAHAILRSRQESPKNEKLHQPRDGSEEQSRSCLSIVDSQSNEGRASFRPFYSLLKKEKVLETPSGIDSKNLLHTKSSKSSERPPEESKNESSSEDSSSEETEPTEYLTLATSSSTHEEPKSSSSSPGFGLEVVTNIEDNSKLFTLLRIIKDSKLESVNGDDSSSGDEDKEVEDLTRDANSVEETRSGNPDTEKSSKNTNIFTMTELSEEKEPVDGLGDILHMFEQIEGEEETSRQVAFQPLDQFEYIEVTSHSDGGIKRQKGNHKKSGFSSDLHIIVLSDEEENVQHLDGKDSDCEQDRANSSDCLQKEPVESSQIQAGAEENTFKDAEEGNHRLQRSPTFVSFIEYI